MLVGFWVWSGFVSGLVWSGLVWSGLVWSVFSVSWYNAHGTRHTIHSHFFGIMVLLKLPTWYKSTFCNFISFYQLCQLRASFCQLRTSLEPAIFYLKPIFFLLNHFSFFVFCLKYDFWCVFLTLFV